MSGYDGLIGYICICTWPLPNLMSIIQDTLDTTERFFIIFFNSVSIHLLPSAYVSKEVLFSNPSILVPELWAIAEHAEPLFCEVYRIEIRCITLLSLTYLQSVAKLDPSQAEDNTRVTGFRC